MAELVIRVEVTDPLGVVAVAETTVDVLEPEATS